MSSANEKAKITSQCQVSLQKPSSSNRDFALKPTTCKLYYVVNKKFCFSNFACCSIKFDACFRVRSFPRAVTHPLICGQATRESLTSHMYFLLCICSTSYTLDNLTVLCTCTIGKDPLPQGSSWQQSGQLANHKSPHSGRGESSHTHYSTLSSQVGSYCTRICSW